MKKNLTSKWAASSALITLLASACGSAGSSQGQSAASLSCPAEAESHFVGTSTTGGGQAAPKFKRLHGHIPRAVASASDGGKLDESKELPITVSLELSDPTALSREIVEIYRPGGAKFHQFLKPAEFHARFGPSQEQVRQVTDYLKQQGLQAVSHDGGLLVHAIGTAAQLNAAFHTEIHQFQDAKGRSYHAPKSELEIPENLAIQGVHGLQSLTLAHNHLRTQASSPKSATTRAATGPSGGFSPDDIRKAYNVPASLDGSGQSLALFELDGYSGSDITAYESKFGLPATPLQDVLVDSASGGAGGGAGEVTLDIELMIALAPKASKILVYEGPNSDTGSLDVYAKIANDNLAQSVSSSWGSSEDSVSASFAQAENTIFMQMAAQGQTIYSAAGDSGANDNGSSLSIDDPSGQPYVVAVGGTALSTDSSGAHQSETTWNDSSGGGGGGISTLWSIPSWQQGLATSTNKASSTMRNIPDVALNADVNTGYSIYYGGGWSVWGGTSCSAPIWAAFNALINQQRAQNGAGPIGYITPQLYSLGKGSGYGSAFFDISDQSTNGFYPAVGGYDAATGWGSFNGEGLIAALSGGAKGGSDSGPSCGG